MSFDDDDDDAELFSFGSGEASAVMAASPSAAAGETAANNSSTAAPPSLSGTSSLSRTLSHESADSGADSDLLFDSGNNPVLPVRKETSDSLFGSVGDGTGEDILGTLTLDSLGVADDDAALGGGGGGGSMEYDQETQDMLDWLDETPATTAAAVGHNNNQTNDTGNRNEMEEVVFVQDDDDDDDDDNNKNDKGEDTNMSSSSNNNNKPSKKQDNKDAESNKSAQTPPKQTLQPQQQPTVVALPPTFDTLQEALQSDTATLSQIKDLAQTTPLHEINDPQFPRPDLYCRWINGNKTAQQTQSSSLADSYNNWTIPKSTTAFWIPKAAQWCCEQVAKENEGDKADERKSIVKEQDLTQLLAYHHWTRSSSSASSANQPQQTQTQSIDYLVPCVATVLLSTGLKPSAASVLLSQVQAQQMPLTALEQDERWEAAQSLHHHLYLLAAYHLPLLVVHLDRCWPGWFAPRQQQQQQPIATDDEAPGGGENKDAENATERARHWDKQGQIPPSWLLSFLSGEVYASNLPMSRILQLWDAQLIYPNSWRFFLTLAVLERAADELILMTGDALVQQLQRAFLVETNIGKSNDEPDEQSDWFNEWMSGAKALYRATPATVLKQLQTVEDEAFQSALATRQERAEAALQARLQAEAAAHQHAQELKAEQARQRLTRARLVAFYRKHCPEKEKNIDKILTNYVDRLEILDAKLYQKYGESFQPALPPPKPESPQKASTSSASTGSRSILGGLGRKKQSDSSAQEVDDSSAARKPDQVSVLVHASEVLPIVCWAKGGSSKRNTNNSHNGSDFAQPPPLKYFLVDSRSEEAASEQGRFPTAVSLSPEAMLDPERVVQLEDKFEALRGAVHICIMGEGFSAIPTLYKQKLSPNLESAMVQDESRTNICALFFIKKGFPFVSVLDGGFAAAHSWLVRDGPKHNLKASSVLVDYDPEASVFGQMETLHNASMTEKAQRQLTSLVENSLVAMTLQAQKLEQMAAEMDSKKQSQHQRGASTGGLRLGAFFKGSAQVNSATSSVNSAKAASSETQPSVTDSKDKSSASSTPQTTFRKNLRNPFARKQQPEPDEAAGVESAERSRSKTPPQKDVSSTGKKESSDDAAPPPPPPKSPTITNNSQDLDASTTSTNSNASTSGPAFLKRNPFRGFGGGAMGNRSQHGMNRSQHGSQHGPSAKPKPAGHARHKSAGGFASFNNLRKTALGRIRSAPGNGNNTNNARQQRQSTTSEEEEESISFD